MQDFRRTGRMPVPDAAWRRATAVFRGLALDDAETEAAIRRIHAATGYLADPHTAIGIEAARHAGAAPVIAMATAHPAKFPDAVEKATGIRPSLPPRLAHLMSGTERFTRAPNDQAAVETLIRAFVHRNHTHFNDQFAYSGGTAA
jgi:threonine synthase